MYKKSNFRTSHDIQLPYLSKRIRTFAPVK